MSMLCDFPVILMNHLQDILKRFNRKQPPEVIGGRVYVDLSGHPNFTSQQEGDFAHPVFNGAKGVFYDLLSDLHHLPGDRACHTSAILLSPLIVMVTINHSAMF